MRASNKAPSALLPLFLEGGPRPQDVRMATGRRDCYLLAASQAVVVQYPNCITQIISAYDCGVLVQPRGGAGAATMLRGNLSDWQGGKARVMWPAAVEAGYAAARGGAAVLLRRGDPANALTWLLGCPAQSFPVHASWAQFTRHVIALFRRGECVVLLTNHHALAVVGVDETEAALHVMNPRQHWWERSCERIRTLKSSAPRLDIVAYSTTQNCPSFIHPASKD